MTNTQESYNEESAKVIASVISSFLDEQASLVEKYRVIVTEKFLQQEVPVEELKVIADRLGLYVTDEDEQLYNEHHDITPEDVEADEYALTKQLHSEENPEELIMPSPDELEELLQGIDKEQEAELQGSLESELANEEIIEENSTTEYQISPRQDEILTAIFNNFRTAIKDPSITFPLDNHVIAQLETELFDTGLFPIYTSYFTPEGLQFVLTPAIIEEDTEVSEYEYYQYTFSGTDRELSIPSERFEFLFGLQGLPEGVVLRNTKNDRQGILLGVDDESDEIRLHVSDVETAHIRNWALSTIVGADESDDLFDEIQSLGTESNE